MAPKKEWPFVGASLFLCDPAHDEDDRKIFDHILKLLRADFQIPEDNRDPRVQILLDDVVNSYSELAGYRSKAKIHVMEGRDEESRRNKERFLRDQIRKALLALMNFTNPKKVEKKVTIENILNNLAKEDE